MRQCFGFHGTDLTTSIDKYHRLPGVDDTKNRDPIVIVMLRTASTLSSSPFWIWYSLTEQDEPEIAVFSFKPCSAHRLESNVKLQRKGRVSSVTVMGHGDDKTSEWRVPKGESNLRAYHNVAVVTWCDWTQRNILMISAFILSNARIEDGLFWCWGRECQNEPPKQLKRLTQVQHCDW